MLEAEAGGRRLHPDISDDAPTAKPSINVGETIKQSDLLKVMRKIAGERQLDLSKREDFEEVERLARCAEKIALGLKGSGSKISFKKYTLEDLAVAGGLTVDGLRDKFPGMSAAELLILLDLISVP